ncbi:PREDICTED: GPI ethanolamine phosphate transferase 2 [Dinoponera quadriceps]|uniref:GPI ethanolamine phosphate transferase 2 n=1 Tax=Dinoponera quadriceps TaxID=609295 RepID=A0A6P3WZY0_DINQU|nr:PREDICTED: GPI ethanolamine phosphate transferase 2 [Dinoponera quadriceps]XP_014471653.1 PREDICTED: GPI ethanolamine phosphate transferase 2 [Dinoponera quadriceps]
MRTNDLLLFYILLIAPISIALFLYGFFPTAHHSDTIATRKDIPQHVENVRIQADILYKPVVKKLIIMVIDALRWDFVASPVGKHAMPMTSSLLANSSGCLLRAKLQSPTVTMPRIKAMMTGTVPNFVDVVLNLGSKPLSSDSLLLQAKRQGHKLVFYGDETWLSLFPNMFKRHDGTTSFFVTDFTEVDNNVTRHVQSELSNEDWSVMILHYLGLDHIGHVEGPFGASIKPKLQEMDEIIGQIARKVQYWNDNSTPSLFVVCGDHGMKDSGGHGGSTLQETTVPFVMIGQVRCPTRKNESKPIEIEQLDIAATLSVAMGLPIPSINLGSVFLDSIYDLSDSKRLFLLYYNTKQLFNHFRRLVTSESQNIHRKYRNTVKLHIGWLNANEKPSEMVENIVSSYNAILKEMKATLIASMVKYDIRSMAAAVFFLFHILCILLVVRNLTGSTFKRTAFFFLLNASLCLGIDYFLDPENTTSLYPTSVFSLLLIVLVISILCVNCYFLSSVKRGDLFLIKVKKGSKMRVFQIGALLHVVSFAGNSFVEEEHQTWYFFWSSTVACLLYRCSGKWFAYHRYCSDSSHQFHVLCIKLLLLLIGHRILRKLNSTGDKYAHLPDIAGWLKDDDSRVGMTLLLLAALVFLIWIAHDCEDKEYKWQSLILNTVIAVCIYLRHMASGAVGKIPSYFSSSGIYEVQTFWGITALFLISCGYRVRLTIKYNRKRFTSTMLFFMINTWVMVSAMLHQPYNVILLPMQIVASSTIDTVLRENNLLDLSVFAHYWLGNVFYFYQGNSNSLASVDVAAGYIGLRSYVPFVTSAYLIVNTYSAPVLAYFLLIYYRQLNETHSDAVVRTSKTYVTWRLFTMTVYTIIVTAQRHHLFVWSVFSPKLLYESMYSVIMCCSTLLVLIVIKLQRAMTPNYSTSTSTTSQF